MDGQEMNQPRSQAEFEQLSDDMALKLAEVVGDEPTDLSVVLSALLKVHRATVALLDKDGRRHESIASAIYARGLLALDAPPRPLTTRVHAYASSHSPNQKGA